MDHQTEKHDEIQDFLAKMKAIQINILKFIENENTIKDDYQSMIQFLAANKIHEDRHELKALLHLISSISNNHHRNHDFFKKFQHILSFLKESIHNFFTNYEIFQIFQSNKRILLFLFSQKLLKMDLLKVYLKNIHIIGA